MDGCIRVCLEYTYRIIKHHADCVIETLIFGVRIKETLTKSCQDINTQIFLSITLHKVYLTSLLDGMPLSCEVK